MRSLYHCKSIRRRLSLNAYQDVNHVNVNQENSSKINSVMVPRSQKQLISTGLRKVIVLVLFWPNVLIKRVGPDTAITFVFVREYVQYTVFVTRTHIKANIDTALGRTGRQTRSRRDIRAVRLLLHSTAVCAFFGLWYSSFTDNNL